MAVALVAMAVRAAHNCDQRRVHASTWKVQDQAVVREWWCSEQRRRRSTHLEPAALSIGREDGGPDSVHRHRQCVDLHRHDRVDSPIMS